MDWRSGRCDKVRILNWSVCSPPLTSPADLSNLFAVDLNSGRWKDEVNVFADVGTLDAEFNFCWGCIINYNLYKKPRPISRESRSIWCKFTVWMYLEQDQAINSLFFELISSTNLVLEYWAIRQALSQVWPSPGSFLWKWGTVGRWVKWWISAGRSRNNENWEAASHWGDGSSLGSRLCSFLSAVSILRHQGN